MENIGKPLKRGEEGDESVERMKRSLQCSEEQLNVARCLHTHERLF